MPYGGKNPYKVKTEFGIGEEVVIDQLKVLETRSTHKNYFNKFFYFSPVMRS